MISGLSHITLIVKDLDRMAIILTEGLGGKEIYNSGDKTFSSAPEKFFLIGDIWLAIMQGNTEIPRSYNHIAFKVSDADIDVYTDRLTALGLEFKPPRSRIEGEGRSVYFYDDDNHLFELHTGTLSERLRHYKTLTEQDIS